MFCAQYPEYHILSIIFIYFYFYVNTFKLDLIQCCSSLIWTLFRPSNCVLKISSLSKKKNIFCQLKCLYLIFFYMSKKNINEYKKWSVTSKLFMMINLHNNWVYISHTINVSRSILYLYAIVVEINLTIFCHQTCIPTRLYQRKFSI